MPYIGNDLATQFQAFATQTITGDGSTGYTLDRAVANGKELLVYINNVKQEEGSGKSYTATGTTITFSAAVTSGDSCYLVYMGSAQQTVVPPDASVGSGQLANANLEMPNTLDMNGKELILDADADTSITADTDDQIDFKTGGTDRMVISSAGKVGIGTSSPSHALSVITSTDGTGLSGDDSFVAILQNAEATDDRSFGVKIMAGSTSSDQALSVQDHDGTKDMFTIKGNGLHSMYLSSSDNNYVVNANPSAGGAGTKQWNLYYKADSTVFTGYHYYAKKDTTETFSMGDVIVLENGKATKCTKAHATNVVGIISGHPMGGGRWLSNNKDEIATEEGAVEVASVGDSQDWNKIVTHYLTGFKVCNENGAIASGDLLCSANKTGYLMKQDGTAITTETVGKSMDDVTFESDGTATGIYGFLYCG